MHSSQKKYKKAVILGAAGFIGVNLAHALLKQGLDVTCFDQALSPEWPEGITAIVGDFFEAPAELLKALNETYIFHLVSSCRPSMSTEQAGKEITSDLIGTLAYLEATKNLDVKWIFISSGGTVYGQQDIPSISESCTTEPICSYGLVKLSIENYLMLYEKLHQLDCVIIRLANPYGPWQDPRRGQGIVAALIYKALIGQTIEIWGDGTNVRDYVYIDDAITGIISAALTDNSGEVFNLGSGSGTSIIELIRIIGHILEVDISIKYVQSRSVDVRRNVLNSTKLSTCTDWETSFDLQSGIAKTIAWMRNFSK
jgi:UDP-glucose 4-epimerase